MKRIWIIIAIAIVALIIGFAVGASYGKKSYAKQLKNGEDEVDEETSETTQSAT